VPEPTANTALDASGETKPNLVLARTARVKALAGEIGFDLIGIAPPALPEAFARYTAAMGQGYGADMGWLYERPELREDARNVWPETQSVIVVGVSYASDTPGYLADPPEADEGWIARYAQGKDYHVYVRDRLIRLVKAIAADPLLAHAGPSTAHRIFSDTGPVLEKAYAQAAGVGWIGKHSLMIHKGEGSWFFLGVVLTPLALQPDTPATDHCGSCSRCMEVCPTDAIVRPYVVDARKCIATWTIESPAPAAVIDPEPLGQHIFGCDLCQEVCPWNRKSTPSVHTPLLPREANIRPKLETLHGLSDADFRKRFPKSSVRRVKTHQMTEVIDVIRDRGGTVE
jgi:epoxyqueuosine reductase